MKRNFFLVIIFPIIIILILTSCFCAAIIEALEKAADKYEQRSQANSDSTDSDNPGTDNGDNGNPCWDPKPDLKVELVDIDNKRIIRGERPWTWIRYRVKNIGQASTEEEYIYLRSWRDGVPMSGYMKIKGPIEPGRSVTNKFAVGDNNRWSYGKHNVKIEVDYRNWVNELNEENNFSREISFRVEGKWDNPNPGFSRKPDLIVELIDIDNRKIIRGVKPWTWIRYCVKNIGQASTTGDIYLRSWKNGSPMSGYMRIKGPIEPGRSVTNKFAVGHNNHWSYGKHNVKIEVDYRNWVNELNEKNNFSHEISFIVKKFELFKTPTHISPANGSVFNHYPRKTTLRWRSVPGVKSYTVEIDCYHCCKPNKWCADIGRTWKLVPNLKTTKYTFNFVGAQSGRWRVWAIGPNGQKSQKTSWWEFRYTR